MALEDFLLDVCRVLQDPLRETVKHAEDLILDLGVDVLSLSYRNFNAT